MLMRQKRTARQPRSSKGWQRTRLSRSGREEHISPRQVQNILDGIAVRAGLQEVKRKDRAWKDRHRVHPHLLRHSFAIWSLAGRLPNGNTLITGSTVILEVTPDHEVVWRVRMKDSIITSPREASGKGFYKAQRIATK
jgi:integrase